MDSFEAMHKRILDKKWSSLEKRGLTRPSGDEQLRRLKELDSLPRGSKQGNEQQASSVAEVSLS